MHGEVWLENKMVWPFSMIMNKDVLYIICVYKKVYILFLLSCITGNSH